MVVNDHQVAHLEIEVHAAAGICHQQRFHTQRFHHTDGRGDVGHGMSLIKMKTPLHAHDAVPGQTAQHKTSRVPRRGGNGKAGNGGVFHKRRILQHIGQTAQPAAQDQAHRRRAPATARMASTAFWIISFKAFPPFASGCFSARSESAG